MPLTALDPRSYGSPRLVHQLLSRPLPLTLALLLACARGADRPAAPLDQLHYPAWLALSGGQLLVVNADQDLAFEGGSILGLDQDSGAIVGGAPLPYLAGKLRLVTSEEAAGCDLPELPVAAPFAMVPGRSEESLHFVELPFSPGETETLQVRLPIAGAAHPYEAALTCGSDRKARAWVSFQRGTDERGYLAQLDLSSNTFPPPVVRVFTGDGAARSFAWDRDRDRLYFTTREHELRAPIRWIDIGGGCKPTSDGVQDGSQGHCRVEIAGIDLSAHLAGAEPNAIALSSEERPCVFGGVSCRRMYVSVRLYDADLARLIEQRPANDIGGKLVVLELAESGLGGVEARWIDDVDIGRIAGEVLVIDRPQGDIVVTAAVTDDVVWIYDDETGAVAKVIGRLASGVPEVGHMPSGLTSRDMGNGNVRVYVASYEDHWVSAVDIPIADPGAAYVVHAGPDPADTAAPYLRLGRAP